ncbi:RNA polymerase sigma factor [Anaerocolumna jejuensis]|uniref:RNA polymerase sigma factor n=1 Tax=Anaerocolumna jejuensis TaxID=259063 RepID=UPI003F7C820E
MQDEVLIKRLKQRDMKAYEEVIDTYKNYVGAIVKSRISVSMRNEDIEEVVADVFVALWKQSDRLDAKKGNLKNYIGIIARNLAINKIRGSYNLLSIDDDMEITGDVSPEYEVMNRETRDILLHEVNTLKSLDKEIITKYYMEGETVKKIAEDMQLNPNTVKAKLLRARKKLKKSLSERGYSYENL